MFAHVHPIWVDFGSKFTHDGSILGSWEPNLDRFWWQVHSYGSMLAPFWGLWSHLEVEVASGIAPNRKSMKNLMTIATS